MHVFDEKKPEFLSFFQFPYFSVNMPCRTAEKLKHSRFTRVKMPFFARVKSTEVRKFTCFEKSQISGEGGRQNISCTSKLLFVKMPQVRDEEEMFFKSLCFLS